MQKIEGHLELKAVEFSYPTAPDTKILDAIDFTLLPGKSLALVGDTGSGKSTIIKLLAKLYDNYSGSIYLDQKDLREFEPTSLRQQIAVVPQEITLFEDTIANNISMGNPEISQEQIRWAANITGAHSFISALPGSYDFKLTSGGSNLSQGQRQLIAFSRALAKQPNLLILDEATASIDPASEQLIQSATAKLFQGRSVIVIAHRLATIINCDEILVLRKGRVIERGNHRQLIEQNGVYASLYQH